MSDAVTIEIKVGLTKAAFEIIPIGYARKFR